jgi:hypothetical protein
MQSCSIGFGACRADNARLRAGAGLIATHSAVLALGGTVLCGKSTGGARHGSLLRGQINVLTRCRWNTSHRAGGIGIKPCRTRKTLVRHRGIIAVPTVGADRIHAIRANATVVVVAVRARSTRQTRYSTPSHCPSRTLGAIDSLGETARNLSCKAAKTRGETGGVGEGAWRARQTRLGGGIWLVFSPSTFLAHCSVVFGAVASWCAR